MFVFVKGMQFDICVDIVVVFINGVRVKEYKLFGGVCIIEMMCSGIVGYEWVDSVMKKQSWNCCFWCYFIYIYDCIGIVNQFGVLKMIG